MPLHGPQSVARRVGRRRALGGTFLVFFLEKQRPLWMSGLKISKTLTLTHSLPPSLTHSLLLPSDRGGNDGNNKNNNDINKHEKVDCLHKRERFFFIEPDIALVEKTFPHFGRRSGIMHMALCEELKLRKEQLCRRREGRGEREIERQREGHSKKCQWQNPPARIPCTRNI